jgi:hypothetical protein
MPRDGLDAIRRLYYDTGPATIRRDLARAIEILKAMPTEEERERATVYMEGLAEMRKEWAAGETRPRKPGAAPKKKPR